MKRILIAIVRLYQQALSPYIGGNCRFYPSCSNYTIEAIEKKGAFIGFFLGIWRILRCNPWNSNSGYDPVEKE
jgi:putative membrane protein insertion efficiency factor